MKVDLSTRFRGPKGETKGFEIRDWLTSEHPGGFLSASGLESFEAPKAPIIALMIANSPCNDRQGQSGVENKANNFGRSRDSPRGFGQAIGMA